MRRAGSSAETGDPRPVGATGPAATLLAVVAMVLWVMVLAASPVAAEPTASRWQWPTAPPHEVLHRFEQPEHQYAAGHRGLDIAANDGLGTEVRAVEAGTVRFAGDVAGRGVVSVLHEDGLLSTYEPVASQVTAGEVVAAGDLLGQVAEGAGGTSHCPEGPCLHLGARQGEHYLDPLLLLGARGPSVLLPWGGAGPSGAPKGTGHESGGDAPLSGRVPASGIPTRPGVRRVLLE